MEESKKLIHETPETVELKPCYDQFAVNPPSQNELTPDAIQAMIDCFRNAANLVRANTSSVEQTPTTAFRAGIVRNNIHIMAVTEDYAERHPDIVSPDVHLSDWSAAINNLILIGPAREEAEKALNSLNNFERANAAIIYREFMRFYRLVKILAADGNADALAIWPIVRQVWDHLRGRRGPICEVKEANNAIMKANEVFQKYGDRYFEIINNQRMLAENLTHAIHKEDEIADHGLHNIHSELGKHDK